MKTIQSGILALLLLLAVFTTACAQSKKAVKSGTAYARVVSATSQRILPGRQESEPVTNYRITIQWRSASKPAAFFWRPEEGWMNTIVVKPGEGEEEVSPEAIRRNQTVIVVPMPDAGRTPVPAFVSSATRNTLFFQVGKTWYSIPVKVTKKQDIATP